MSEITIVYRELEEASQKAQDIEGDCKDYGEELNTTVSAKMGSVPETPLPGGNSRLNMADRYVSNKRKALEKKESRYKEFAKKCEDLSTNAKNADKRVGQQVNTSRDTFLNDHPGLKGDGWNMFIASLIADVPILGWVVDKLSDIQDMKRDVKNTIRKWYDIDGGKKVVDTALAIAGVVIAIVGAISAVASAVSAVAAAIAAGIVAGPILAAIAAVVVAIGAVIGVINAVVNLGTQIKADTCKDPAFANFYGQQNDLATVLEKKTFRGDQRHWNNGSMKLAKGIKITETVCAVVGIAKGITDIAKNSGLKDMFSKKVKVKGKGVYKGETIEVEKFDFSKMKKTLKTKEGRKEILTTLKKNAKKMLLGDKPDKDNNPEKSTLEKMQDFVNSKNKEGKMKSVVDIGVKAEEFGEKIEKYDKIAGLVDDVTGEAENRLNAYLYNEYDVHGLIDRTISLTGTEGAVGLTNEVYGFVKDTADFDDKIRFKGVKDGRMK